MAKRKPTATQRLRKLVQQQVRRMENRGYRIDTELKEKIKTGKYQTLQSIRRNKYAKLYEGSSAEIDTNIVSGRRFRQYERKVSAEKAVQTRRQNQTKKWKKSPIRETAEERALRESEHDYGYDEEYEEDDYGYDEEWTDADERSFQRWKEKRDREYLGEGYEPDSEEQHDWEETRARQDEEEAQIAQDINQGEIMYRNVQDLIDKFPREGANILQNALASEINKYGLDLVMAGMAQAPIDVVEESRKIVHYNGTKENIHRSITNLFDAITGTIRTIQESKVLGEAMDQMTDMSEL